MAGGSQTTNHARSLVQADLLGDTVRAYVNIYNLNVGDIGACHGSILLSNENCFTKMGRSKLAGSTGVQTVAWRDLAVAEIFAVKLRIDQLPSPSNLCMVVATQLFTPSSPAREHFQLSRYLKLG